MKCNKHDAKFKVTYMMLCNIMQRNKGKVQNKNNELPTLGIVALGQHFLTRFLCKTYYKTTK